LTEARLLLTVMLCLCGSMYTDEWPQNALMASVECHWWMKLSDLIRKLHICSSLSRRSTNCPCSVTVIHVCLSQMI